METRLLPCPFCGGNDVHVGWTDFDSGVIFVECESCGMHCEPKDCYANEPKAIAAWNRRAETRAERDLRDELNWMHAEEHGTRLRLWRALNTISDCTRELLDHAGVPYIVMPVTIEEALCEATCHVTGKRYDLLRGGRVVFGRWGGA